MTADPRAVFVRKVLPAVHTAVAGSVLIGTLTLSRGLDEATLAEDVAEDTVVVGGTSPASGAWTALLSELREVPGLEAESLATPGALLGLGVRDHVLTQCGPCVRGGLPAPFWGADANHHSVTPGFFGLAGIELVAGRLFDGDDVLGAEQVVIVNQTFANSSFYRGNPIGRKLRLAGFQDWYEVVGVVADARVAVLGADDRPREAVYLNAAQRPARSGHILLRGTDTAVEASVDAMRRAGFAPSEPQSHAEYRAGAVAPLRWLRAVALGLAILAFLLAAQGVHTAAVQVTRRRTAELAIRRVLGASAGRIMAHVLGERVRVTAWGLAGVVFWGSLLAAFLGEAAGLPSVGPGAYAAVGSLLLVIATTASVSAARQAVAVDPASIME